MITLLFFHNLVVSTSQLTVVLVLTSIIFLFFIAIAIIKMYKLKSENKRLSEMDTSMPETDDNYTDFTDGHLYNK